MSLVTSALRHAREGDPVFSIRRGTKNKPQADWANGGATVNPADAFDNFAGQDTNLGVRTDRLVVVDVDAHRGGMDTLASHPELPPTFTVRTPNGGLHLYYRAPARAELFGGVNRLGQGVDIKTGPRSYVLGAGSSFEGKEYRVERDVPAITCPEWLVGHLTARQRTADAPKAVGELDTPAAVESARSYLDRSAPPAVEGSGGNETAYRVACAVKDRGISEEAALELMLEHWNSRCSPEWEPDELSEVVEHAYRYGQAAIGRDNPAAGFVPIEFPKTAEPRLLKFARDISMAAIKSRETNATIKGLIRPGEIGLTYGESTAGKTFEVLDRCWHIALGKEWRGKKTKRRPVLYVCMEGEHGFEKRVEAIKRQYGDAGDYFATLAVPVTLVRADAGAQGLKTIVAAFRQLLELSGEATGHIVVDTLARAMAGDDENSTKDMMFFISDRVTAIRSQTGASVEVIHHTNKLGEVRGNSSLKPAVDFMFRIDRSGPTRTMVAEKVKDGEDGAILQSFTLEQVRLDIDDDGVPITSCIVKSCEALATPPTAERKKREPKGWTYLRKAFSAAIAKSKQVSVTDPETGEDRERIAISDALRPEFFALYPSAADGAAALHAKRKAFTRALGDRPPEFRVLTIGGTEYIWLETAEW